MSGPAQASVPDPLPLSPDARCDVRDFGAVGDGVHDDYPAFDRALAWAGARAQIREIRVPDGTYYVVPPQGAEGHLVIADQRELVLRGSANTLLVMGSPWLPGIVVTRGERVRLESLAIDYRPLPFTQGTITDASPLTRSFVVRLDPGFPRLDADHMSREGGVKNIAYLYPPGSTILDTDLHDQYHLVSTRYEDPDHVRLTTRSLVLPSIVGRRTVVVGRRNAPAVLFKDSSHSVADRVRVHAAPGAAFALRYTDAISLVTCRVEQLPGSRRILSSNADGVHVKWGRTGPHIVNGHFEGMADDGANIGGTYQLVRSLVSPRVLEVERHPALRAGERIALVRHRTGNVEPLPPCVRVERRGAHMRLHFSEDLPHDMEPAAARDVGDLVINLDQVAEHARIENSFFGRHRGRGIILHAPGAKIAGNRFQDLLGPGIRLGHHYPERMEGPNGSYAQIRDNTFARIQLAPIHLTDGLRDPRSRCQSIRGVEITANRFEDYGRPPALRGGSTHGNAIYVDNARDIKLIDNQLAAPHRRAPEVPRVVLDEVQDVTIVGAPGQRTGSWFELTPRADAASVTGLTP